MVFTLLDKIYKEYNKTTNMSFSELKRWSMTELSKQASLTRSPIKRNLELLKLPKDKWGKKQITWAIRTIKFIKRMRKLPRGEIVKNKLSKRDIALKNWGFNVRK